MSQHNPTEPEGQLVTLDWFQSRTGEEKKADWAWKWAGKIDESNTKNNPMIMPLSAGKTRCSG